MVRPRYASTVVLLRPGNEGGFEVLLTRRPAEMRFLGGYYVFPGGTVHAGDRSAAVLARCRGLSGEQARKILGSVDDPAEAVGHWVAVVRELFEEVGILLCETASGGAVDLKDAKLKNRFEAQRRAIVQKQLGFGSFLEAENLYCDLSRAVYFDHWVTPEIYSMRFDTRFYAAAAPPDQSPLARSEEVTHSLWIRPAEALAQIHRRDFPILPPTTTVLHSLSRLASWEQLQAEFKLP
jgi:8-oxo-dGTP pyrophosphatase MutT (NUDIX family)